VLKTSLVNLMSYSTAPVAWGRDNLAFVDASHIVGTQFGIWALRTWTDARHARTDTWYSCLVGGDRTDILAITNEMLPLERSLLKYRTNDRVNSTRTKNLP
jgi:hypothetical protein